MQFAETIKRKRLSDYVEAAIRRLIVDQELVEGARINEVHLAKLLGVSRTPLREALARLQSEGAIEAQTHHGYYVKPLTLEEFDQIYELRPILDPAALRMAGIPNADTINELVRLNEQLEAEQDGEVAIDLDDKWHRMLLSACPNKILIEMITGICARTRRYELMLMREQPQRERAAGEHHQILDALHRSDLEAACVALEQNMRSGKAPITAWLRDRKNSKAELQST
jgi:DNA-binding GntR family transcriptional regulator